MTSDVVLREMRWQDIETLARLEVDLFAHDAWSQPTWWSELAARPRRRYTVAATGDGSVAGYAGLDCAGEVADVMTIAVAPTRQGHGLGARLLAWLIGQATASGANALLLEVRADNGPARNLYRRHGFEQISTRRGYYQPGGVDALVLRRHLEGGTNR